MFKNKISCQKHQETVVLGVNTRLLTRSSRDRNPPPTLFSVDDHLTREKEEFGDKN